VFATGNAISVIAGLWKVIVPAAGTVQASLDAIDAWLTAHLGGAAAHRHSAKDVDYTPHGFVASSTVQAAVDELVDDLSSTAAANAGMSRVGAAGVAGMPVALGPGTAATQLASLLTALNAHLNATQGAHPAVAVATTPFAYLGSQNLQAVLQELVTALAATTGSTRIGGDAIIASPHGLPAGTVAGQMGTLLNVLNGIVLMFAGPTGSTQVGGNPIPGIPDAIPAGSVASQLAALLVLLNAHLNTVTNAHAASAIAVSAPGQLLATTVLDALSEVVAGFAKDHFRTVDGFAGDHKTIHQPTLGSGHVVLWSADPVGIPAMHFEVGADSSSVWFTLNARWSGSGWQRDISAPSAGFRFSCTDFAFLYDASFAINFASWGSSWTLPMGSNLNSALQASGVISERGRISIYGNNSASVAHSVQCGASATFRSRFPAAPSSITLFPIDTSVGFGGTPQVSNVDLDGFNFSTVQLVAANGSCNWIGAYSALA
jgi:hypothetical protein